jgi:hypothetical protein
MYKNKDKLALSVIKQYVETGRKLRVEAKEVDRALRQKAACFVTVYVNGGLRGCTGNAVTVGPLYKTIIHNAVETISHDYRFVPIIKEDLPDLTVEVSVLTPLTIYQPKNNQSLLTFLAHRKPGLVLKKFGLGALFLPQVWKELPNAENFLSRLCLKAGLSPKAWKEHTSFWIFSVQ